jgi:hypothetical protein
VSLLLVLFTSYFKNSRQPFALISMTTTELKAKQDEGVWKLVRGPGQRITPSVPTVFPTARSTTRPRSCPLLPSHLYPEVFRPATLAREQLLDAPNLSAQRDAQLVAARIRWFL